MKNRTSFLFITTLAGFLTLACFSIIQRKIMGFSFTADPRAFLVPIIYGGTIGLILGLRQLRIWKNEAELHSTVEILQEKSEELQAADEMLRQQIDEYVEIRDRLMASEKLLQDQNNELLATEEMLRVQIEEYETNRKLLQESNKNLQTFFDLSPLPIVISRYPGDLIREVNQTFIYDFGYPQSDVVGKTCNELGLWDYGDIKDSFHESLHEQQGLSGFATQMKNFGGESLSVLLYSSLMDYENEKCQLFMILDVTKQKRLEDQIRQTQKMDVIGQLAGGIAHDFNNMLSAILGSSELIQKYVKDNSTALKLLGNIQKAANRSAELTGQLLAFSRKGQKSNAQICLHETIKEAVALLERTVDKKITLKTKLIAKEAMVIGDEALLENALLNLGVNARDAMPDGGVITYSTANVNLDFNYCELSPFNILPGPYIEISVSDTGIGIEKEIFEQIFEPFFTTKEVGKGTGLGLPAVYGTVTDHNGCINIFSEPGLGSVFKLYLPLSGEKKVESASPEPLISGSGGILFVDDEEIMRDVAQAMLEDLGYQVYLAVDGEDALVVYAREVNNISLVIMDMVMPKMGGKETLVQLIRNFPAARVLMSSGFHQEGTVEDLLQLGACGFIQKPYRKIELCKAVAMARGDKKHICSEEVNT